MADTTKTMSERDADQSIRSAFNDVDKSIATSGFLTSKVGHKVSLAISTTSVADDTETYTFSDDGVTLYQIVIIYADTARTLMLSAERTA